VIVLAIARIAFTSEDRVRDVIRNFNADGFASLYPRYKGGRPPRFSLPQRREIKKIAKSRPAEHDLPFSTWSLSKLAEFLVAEGVVGDISHEGLRVLARSEHHWMRLCYSRLGHLFPICPSSPATTSASRLPRRDQMIVLADKGLAGREMGHYAADQVHVLLARPDRKDERRRFGNLAGMRQWIEAIIDTLKGQLDLERHGGRTPAGVFTRVAQRLLALAACIWHNWSISTTSGRSLIAYDH